MLTSPFLSHFYILHSKSKLWRLYGNSSTACSLLLCYTLPCSWTSQRSQGTAGPRAQPHGRESHEVLYPYQVARWHRSCSHPGALVKHGKRMQPHVTHFWEAALVKDANSQFSPHHVALAAQEPPFQSLFFPTRLWCPGRSTGKGQPRSIQPWGAMRYFSPGHKPHRVVLSVDRRWWWMPVHPVRKGKFRTQPGSPIQGMQKLLHIWIGRERTYT